MSTAPSAPAATAAPFWNPPTAASRASTAIPRAIADGAPLADSFAGRLTLVEGRFGEMERPAGRQGRRMPPTASRSISASPPCSSTKPSAASPSAPTGRSTCAWAAKARARPIWSTTLGEAELADIIFRYGEERAPARDRPRHRPPPRARRRSRAPASSPRSCAASSAASSATPSIRRPAPSRRCASR